MSWAEEAPQSVAAKLDCHHEEPFAGDVLELVAVEARVVEGKPLAIGRKRTWVAVFALLDGKATFLGRRRRRTARRCENATFVSEVRDAKRRRGRFPARPTAGAERLELTGAPLGQSKSVMQPSVVSIHGRAACPTSAMKTLTPSATTRVSESNHDGNSMFDEGSARDASPVGELQRPNRRI